MQHSITAGSGMQCVSALLVSRCVPLLVVKKGLICIYIFSMYCILTKCGFRLIKLSLFTKDIYLSTPTPTLYAYWPIRASKQLAMAWRRSDSWQRSGPWTYSMKSCRWRFCNSNYHIKWDKKRQLQQEEKDQLHQTPIKMNNSGFTQSQKFATFPQNVLLCLPLGQKWHYC